MPKSPAMVAISQRAFSLGLDAGCRDACRVLECVSLLYVLPLGVDSRDEEAAAGEHSNGTDRIVSRRCACQHCLSLRAGYLPLRNISWPWFFIYPFPGYGFFWHCRPCLLRVFRPILLSFKPPRIAVIHFSDEAFFHDGVPSGNRIAGQLEVVCQTVRDKATKVLARRSTSAKV